MLAAMQERTQYRPITDIALMRWIVRHAAWLIPRFRSKDAQSAFYRAMGGLHRGKLLQFGETVLAHLLEVGKGSGNPAPKFGRQVEIRRAAWARATSRTNTLFKQTTELCMLEVYDDLSSTAGHKKTFYQSSELHRSRGRHQRTMQLLLDPPSTSAKSTRRRHRERVRERERGKERGRQQQRQARRQARGSRP